MAAAMLVACEKDVVDEATSNVVREAIGNLTAGSYLCLGGTGYRAFKPTDAAFSTSSSNVKASTVLRPVAVVTLEK